MKTEWNSNGNRVFYQMLCLFILMASFLYMPSGVQAATNIVSQISASSGKISSVAFGNGIFVAVGENASISTSTNAVDWTIVPRESNAPTFTKVVFANGKFVAIDGVTSKVYSSTDGVTWTSTNLSFTPQNVKSVNGKIFVWRSDYINGSNPPDYNVKLYYSSDSTTWTNTNLTKTAGSFSDMAYGGGKYIVAGSNFTYYSSTNLSAWTTVSLNTLLDKYNYNWPYIGNVSYLNGRFYSWLSTPYTNKVITSTDGTNWTGNASWNNNPFNGGDTVNSKAVLLGDNGRIYHSSTNPAPASLGTGWTTANTRTTMRYSSIVFGNGKYVAVGDSGISVSSDLVTWTYPGANLKSIAFDGTGTYTGISYNGYAGDQTFGSMYKSSNLVSWTEVGPSAVPPGLNAVAYGSGKFVAVSDPYVVDYEPGNAHVYTSSDGTSWTRSAQNFPSDWLSGVAFGAGKFAMVTYNGNIYSSTDGTSWTSRYQNANYPFNTVSFVNNQFVAVGIKYDNSYNLSHFVIARSADGISWGIPVVVASAGSDMKGIAYGDGMYIAVGTNASGQAVIWKSTDLASWTNVSVDADGLTSISYGSGGFLAAGTGGTMLSSVDGTTWTAERSNVSSSLAQVIYDGAHFATVGNNFTVMGLTLASSVPTITSQPSNASVNEGSNMHFGVTATGTGLTYQWQVDTGSGFANITDGGVYSGATGSTLSLTGATSSMNGYTYRVVVTGSHGLSTTSSSATLTVNSAPTITSQPGNASVNEGSNTSFSVAATGTGLTYQWQVDTGSGFANITDGSVYSGATGSMLNLTGVTPSMNGYTYRVVVTGSNGLSTTSNLATLTVNSAPTITSQPGNASVNEGSNTSFSVAATGTGLTYQWQVDIGSGFTNITDGGVYSGATGSTLSLTGATSSMNDYKYRVVVTGSHGLFTTSNHATLTVNLALTYSIIGLDDTTMIALTAGYQPSTQETKIITITRTGTGDLANVAVALSGTNANDFEITQPLNTTLTDSTSSTTFTIKAKDGLAAGTYVATVTISADSMADETFTVTQVVNAANLNYMLGDVNNDGAINMTDVYLIHQYVKGKITFTETQLLAANVNRDTLVNATDAQLIQSYYLKKISVFPDLSK